MKWLKRGFNSKVVQLKAQNESDNGYKYQGFNSKVVQLKGRAS